MQAAALVGLRLVNNEVDFLFTYYVSPNSLRQIQISSLIRFCLVVHCQVVHAPSNGTERQRRKDGTTNRNDLRKVECGTLGEKLVVESGKRRVWGLDERAGG